MATQVVYTTTFHSQSDDTFRIDIVDVDYAAEGIVVTNQMYGYGISNLPREFQVIHESPTITWDGNAEELAQPLIGSKLEFTALLEDEHKGLLAAMKQLPEHRLCAEVYRHNGASSDLSTESNWDIYWRGVLVHEAVNYSYSCYPIEISMVFTDGLALLKDQPYLDPDTDADYLNDGLEGTVAGSSFAPLRVQIGRCLKRLPHNALWGDQDDYFTEQIDLFHWNHIDETANPDEIKSILDKTGCDQRIWYEIRDYEDDWYRKSKIVTNGSTCYQILSDIMVTMGASFYHANGMFNVTSPFMQESDSVINGKRKFLADKRSLLDSSYAYSAYSQPSGWADGTTFPNLVDLTDDQDDQKYLIVSSRSWLAALQRVSLTHRSGGAPLIFSQKHNKIGYICGVTGATSGTVVPNPVNENLEVNYGYQFPLTNSESIVPADSELNLRGKVRFGHDLLVDADDDKLGLQPVLRFEIKVGNYYLKQTVQLMSSSDFSNDSDFGTIRVALGNNVVPSGNDITGWLPVEITDQVQWTTNSADRFELPLLLPDYLQETHDTIEYVDSDDNAYEYPVGFFTKRANNHPNQMSSSNSEQNGTYERTLELDIVLPPVPDAVAEHTGVKIDIEVIVYDNQGSSVVGTTADNSDPFSCQIIDFQLFNGDESYDQDTLYFASHTNPAGAETYDVGETSIGTRPAEMYGELGALVVGDGHRTANRASAYGDHWFSQSLESFPTSDAGSKNLDLVVRSHFSNRQQTISTYKMEILTRNHHSEFIVPTRRVKLEEGDSEPVVQVQSCQHNLMQGVMSFQAYEVDRILTNMTTDNSTEAFDTLIGPKGPKGSLPGDFATTKVSKVGGGAGLTQEQINKLLAITINANGDITDFTVASGSDPLDVSEVSGAASTTTVATLQQRVTDIERVTDNVTLDQANNISQIATNQDAIAASSILQTSTKQFVTQAQSVQIGTNETDIANLSTTLDAVTDVIKGSTAGTGKGLYSDTNSTTESSVVVNANLISASVETGSSGTETSTTALRITGGTTAGDATVNFDVPTAGISHNDLDDRPPLYHGIGLDAAGTGGFLIGSGSVAFVVGDLLSFTYDNNAGIYQCISATTINRDTSPSGVFTNWLANLSSFTHIGARGDLSLGSLDSSTSSDSFSDSLATFTLTCSSTISISSSSLIGLFGTVFSTGSITAAGFSTTGTGTVGTLVASNLNYPTSDGTSGQVLQTDGSGNLSFATSGGGYSGPVPLTTISGRWQWSSTDSNERVMTGMSTYGPYNWYSHTTEPSISTILTYTGTEVVDSTNGIMPAYYHQAFGVQIPTTDKKVRVDFAFRMQNFGSGGKIGMSLWGADYPSQGNTGNVTWTLRGESADVTTTSTSNIALYTGSFTTTSIVTEDTLLPMWEHRGGTTLSTTSYIFGNFHVYLVD